VRLTPWGVITTSRGCFERCCSNKNTPPYHYNLSFVTLRNRRPTELVRTPRSSVSNTQQQILALTLLHIHTLMPLSGLCALERCGLACCGRRGVQRCAHGAGEKPVAFCRTLILFTQKENSRNCEWVAGGLSPCECVCWVQL